MGEQMKTVIITGATSGIGLALAKVFAGQGWHVGINGRNPQKVAETVRLLQKQFPNGKFSALPADISREEACASMISKFIEEAGCIHVLVNNAGITHRSLFQETDTRVLHQVMNINFWGTVYSTKYALPYLLKTQGTIAVISSVAGIIPLPARTLDSAYKAAMEAFFVALRRELLPTGVSVSIIRPGFVATPIREKALTANGLPQKQSPLNESEALRPEYVARKIFLAISKKKKLVTIARLGEKIPAYIQSLVPSLLDKLVWKAFLNEPNSPLKKYIKSD